MSIKSFDKLRKYLPFGAFGVSLLLHLAIFLGISGIIIIQATSPKAPFTATPDTTQQAGDIPPPELPPDEAPATPDVNTSPDDNHSSSSQLMPSMETISSNNSISAPTFNVLPSGPIATGGAPQNPAPGTSGNKSSEQRTPSFSPFGSSDIVQGGSLEGYFYDFKTGKDGKSTGMSIAQWQGIMKKFINSSNWNPADFNDYYKSPSPLYIQKFFITTRGSIEAPKAFKVPNQPALWSVLYKGSIIPPEDGTYSFAGFGDDLLAVRINGRLVLDGGWLQISDISLKTYPNLWSKVYKERGELRLGKTFAAKAGEPLKIEILIGDQGGWCAYFLMIKKEGKSYEKLKDGTLKLPLFQLDTTPVKAEGEYPPFSTDMVPWKALK
ncbi:MAG: hypothetical protein LBH01_00285 [Verrucomicrobiales bacterium]|jgi:hypothetical protein|nr:hypothetical protein [Verrucomicrobiales bacterium]